MEDIGARSRPPPPKIVRVLRRGARVLVAAAKPRRVDFLIAGTQKGGTSALDAYLGEHPEICMPERHKELHFFDDERLARLPLGRRALYHSFFRPCPQHRVVGECTPIYMYWEPAAQRIWQYNPEMKILVVLRNPIERAFSHWNMQRERGVEQLSFWDAIHRERERARQALPLQDRAASYVDRGFYSLQLQRLWQFFSREQTLILRSEELQSDPTHVLDRVAAFLGVSPFGRVAAREVHARAYAAGMEEREREVLRGIFASEIGTLERLLGWDCRTWLA